MRLKVLALSLSLLFFGSIATSTYAMTTDAVYKTVLVDDDDDKTKAKNSKTKKSSECSSKEKSECCQKSCDEKKASSDKK